MENEHEETSYVGVGKCYFMLTQHEESIDCLKKAIEKNSKNPTTYLYLAKNYKAL
jgi:tetratricopeptide (TPR) repeat protein